MISLPGSGRASSLPRGVSYYGIRIIALIGILFFLERTASFLLSREQVRPYIPDALVNSTWLGSPLAPGVDVDKMLSHFDTHNNNASAGAFPAPSARPEGTKAIIVASIKREKTAWVRENFPDWDVNIYVANDPKAPLTVPKQAGHEVSVFLTYIIQHYNALPEYMVFIHARRYQWHNDDPLYDSVPTIKNLRLEHVKKVGYQSMRCAWVPGCDSGRYPLQPPVPGGKGHSPMYAQLQVLFPGKPVPRLTRAPCCATFAVHRDRVLARPVWEWQQLRQHVYTMKSGAFLSGRIFEYTWHMIMGQPAESCPHARDCYCQTFGLCNLTCPHKSYCEGRWKLPPWGHMVPVDKGWPEKTGIFGYPKRDWFKKWEPWRSGGDPFGDPRRNLQKGTFRWDFRQKRPPPWYARRSIEEAEEEQEDVG